jgi:hypothetical protein
VRAAGCVKVGGVQTAAIFGIHLLGQILKLLLVSDVFERDHVVGV